MSENKKMKPFELKRYQWFQGKTSVFLLTDFWYNADDEVETVYMLRCGKNIPEEFKHEKIQANIADGTLKLITI